MTATVPGQARMVVDLTADDYADFAAYVYKRPELRRRRYRSHLRFGVLMIVALLAYLIWQTWDGKGPNWGALLPVYFQGLAVGLGILALLALAYEYLLPGLVKMNTRRMLAKQPDTLYLGRHELDFGPDGVTDTTATASGHMAWSDVRRVEETPEHLYVILGTLQGVIIPKRGQDAATLQAVRTQMRAHVADTQFLAPSA
ncbi:YcxB family protein [Achromobacter mucicolens]|uniref:YcxB family protein n=1 Tax=Achromobacter mucicolens TaxID=1389922 RepID=UPI001CBE6C27|nr:YcxB family protein [Achromobacter mucicolens]MDH1522242.1 YcxB family protein [Achromobacter mucicolens]UAN02978.1 YcxB family protein [Achromobacter mucicolens]